ncbi:MAG: hypothetical protein M1813_006742 [Trichoglossum hirsutum]|nr:MAG: hypothetical protein M1813_006742 [Trichoglossum hirsutum]
MERQTMREIPQSQKGSKVTGTGEASSSGQQQPQRQAATNLILDYEKIARKKRKQAARLREIEKEMLEKAAKRPVIDISPEEKRIMIQDLRNILSTLARVIKTTPLYYYLTGNERVIRKLVMIRVLLLQQFQDNLRPRDSFNITLQELGNAKEGLRTYFRSVKLLLERLLRWASEQRQKLVDRKLVTPLPG